MLARLWLIKPYRFVALDCPATLASGEAPAHTALGNLPAISDLGAKPPGTDDKLGAMDLEAVKLSCATDMGLTAGHLPRIARMKKF